MLGKKAWLAASRASLAASRASLAASRASLAASRASLAAPSAPASACRQWLLGRLPARCAHTAASSLLAVCAGAGSSRLAAVCPLLCGACCSLGVGSHRLWCQGLPEQRGFCPSSAPSCIRWEMHSCCTPQWTLLVAMPLQPSQHTWYRCATNCGAAAKSQVDMARHQCLLVGQHEALWPDMHQALASKASG